MRKQITSAAAFVAFEIAAVGLAAATGSFTTIPASAAEPTTNSTAESFTFGAAGDFGKNDPGTNAYNNFATAGKAGLSFFQVDGDLSYSDPAKYPETKWCSNVKGVMKNPVVLVAGNHESGLNPEKGHPNHGLIDNFVKPDCLPNRMNITTSSVANTTAPNPANYGREFFFDYGQQKGTNKPLARMIYISAGEYLPNGELWSYKKGDAHYEWTKKAIEDAHAAGIKWVIVSNHTNFVTVGHHGDEVGKDLYNMMLDEKTDLFINGHDHTYQRSKQFAHTDTCSEMLSHTISQGCIVGDGKDGHYTAGKGMMQVIAGTGGADFHSAKPEDTEWGYMSKVMGDDYQTYGFLKINVTQDAINGKFVNVKGPFTDSFTIDNNSTPAPTTPTENTKTFTATEDTFVDSAAPTTNNGKASSLQIDSAPSTKRSYVRYNATGLKGKTIKSAKLRFYVTDPSNSSQNIAKTSSSWSEASTIYNNRPGSSTTNSASVTGLKTGWNEVSIPVSDITGDGVYSYGIHPKGTADTDGLDIASRESANKPQLIVTTN